MLNTECQQQVKLTRAALGQERNREAVRCMEYRRSVDPVLPNNNFILRGDPGGNGNTEWACKEVGDTSFSRDFLDQ